MKLIFFCWLILYVNDFSDTLSLTIAKKILGGFEQHYRNIKKASIEAKRCFEEREWVKIEKDFNA